MSNKYIAIILTATLLIFILTLSGCGLFEKPAYADIDIGNTPAETSAALGDGENVPGGDVSITDEGIPLNRPGRVSSVRDISPDGGTSPDMLSEDVPQEGLDLPSLGPATSNAGVCLNIGIDTDNNADTINNPNTENNINT